MKKLDPCIFKGLWFFLLVATSKLWFPLLNDNRVALLSSTIIVCIGYLIYDLIVNRPHIKENIQIRTKNIDRIAGNLGMVTAVAREGPQDGQRGCELGLRRRQAFGETVTMETLRKEDEEMGKFAEKMKEKQELSTTRKGINFPMTVEEVRMHDLARVQKAKEELEAMDRLLKVNKELVAKLEEVEKDKKIAVETKIQLVKVVDEVNKELVSCLDYVEKLNKELVAKLEEVKKDNKIAIETKIQLVKILDKVNKDSVGKIWCLDHVQKVNKELVAKLEKAEKDKKIAVESRIELMKILDEERKKVSALEKKCVNLEEGIQSQRIANKEREMSYKPKIVEEENVKNKCEDDIMFGSEDDTVYVDFDDFQAIENV